MPTLALSSLTRDRLDLELRRRCTSPSPRLKASSHGRPTRSTLSTRSWIEQVVADPLVVLVRGRLAEARRRPRGPCAGSVSPPQRGEQRRAQKQRASGGEAHRRQGSLRSMDRAPLVDGHGRQIGDVRVSVTDRCNFRCQYCMPAEGLPWLERAEVLSFEEIAAPRRAAGLDGRRASVRLTGGEPLVRRDFPRLAAMLAAIPAVDDLALTTNGFLLERDAAALVDAGIDRFNVSVDSLQRDRFFAHDAPRRAAARARGLEALAALPEAHPIKVNAVAMRGVHRGRGRCPSRASPASTPTRCASSSSCRWTATARGTASQVLTGDETARDHRRALAARGRAARAARHRARLPLRRRPGPHRLHQPGLRAVLRRLRPHPPHRRRQAAHLPVLAQRDRPARRRCALARPTTTSRQIVRDAVWRKELKHRVNEPGFVQPARTMSRHRRLTAPASREPRRPPRRSVVFRPGDEKPPIGRGGRRWPARSGVRRPRGERSGV